MSETYRKNEKIIEKKTILISHMNLYLVYGYTNNEMRGGGFSLSIRKTEILTIKVTCGIFGLYTF